MGVSVVPNLVVLGEGFSVWEVNISVVGVNPVVYMVMVIVDSNDHLFELGMGVVVASGIRLPFT